MKSTPTWIYYVTTTHCNCFDLKGKYEDEFMNTICWNYTENVCNHVVKLPVQGLNPTITPFLRGWVKYLPSIITFWEILSVHPGLYPTMKIPEKMENNSDTLRVSKIESTQSTTEHGLYQIMSFLPSDTPSSCSLNRQSTLMLPSVSWAELKFVTHRVGMPKQRRTAEVKR